MDSIVHAEGLTKKFGDFTAVDGIDFEITRGEIFGFLGPNGAGKTTTIKMLTTLIPPTGGQASVFGIDITKDPLSIRRRIGVVQQQESYELGLTTEQSLNLYGLMWNVSKPVRKQRVEMLLEQFGLKDARKTQTSELSIGQKRRLQVAREFIHDMELLFLDEPTVGLDALVRRSTLDFIKEKVREGLTIFFTTHILEEAEYLCNRVGVINHGKIISIDSPENLKRHFGRFKAIEVTVAPHPTEELQSRIKSLDTVEKVDISVNGGPLKVLTQHPEEVIPQILPLIDRLGLKLTSIYLAEPTLEEAFIRMLTPEGAAK